MLEETEGKEGVAAEKGTITDRFSKSENITISGSACTLHYVSQGNQFPVYKLLHSLQADIRVPKPPKPTPMLGLDRSTPPHSVRILPVYAYIWRLGYQL